MIFVYGIISLHYKFNTMTDLFDNKLKAMMSIQLFYKNNEAEMADLPIISQIMAELDARVLQIFDYLVQVNGKLTGHAESKQDKREKLTLAILKISDPFAILAKMNGEVLEAKRFGLSLAALNKKKANDLYTFAQELETAALPKLALLAPFGVLAGDFDEMTNQAAVFLIEKDNPKLQISERAAKNKEMNALMRETYNDLLQRLDSVMGLLQFSKPFIFYGYRLARKVEKVAVRKKIDYNETIAPATLKMVDELPYSASRMIIFRNMGKAALRLSLSDSPTEPKGKSVVVKPHKSTERLSTTLNSDSNSVFLLVQNLDAKLEGSFKIILE